MFISLEIRHFSSISFSWQKRLNSIQKKFGIQCWFTKNVYLTEINTFPHYHFLSKKDSIPLRKNLETNVDLLNMFISLELGTLRNYHFLGNKDSIAFRRNFGNKRWFTKNVYLTEINTFPHNHFLNKKDSKALRKTLETNVD